MGTRRTHVKSRNGCAQCKKRRIKCDERPPCCGNCGKRGIKCEYGNLFKSYFSASEVIPVCKNQNVKIAFEIDKLSYKIRPSVAASSTSENETAVAKQGLSPSPLQQIPANRLDRPFGSGIELVFPELPYQDQAIFHHYMTVTTRSITTDVRRLDRWRSFIPSAAKDADYTMHSLLGFSALHLAHIQPESRRQYLTIATSHQCQALAKFRSEVEIVNTNNVTPVLIFSCFLVLYELGLMHPNHQICDVQDPITKFIRSVTLIQNTVKSLRTVPWLKVVPIMRLLLRPNGNETAKLPLEVYHALHQLDILNESTTVDEHERQTYADAIQHLRTCFELVSGSPGEWLPSLRWTNLISPHYIKNLQEKQPMALIILVHFCLLVYHSPERWWLKGWNETIVKEVMQLLDESWRPHLRWAVNAMKPGTPLLETSGKGIPSHGNIPPLEMVLKGSFSGDTSSIPLL